MRVIAKLDRVRVLGGGIGQVMDILNDSDYVVEFSNGKKETYKSSSLEITEGDEARCPVCFSTWHVSWGAKEYKDCLKCNKKSEDIFKDEIELKNKLNEEFNMMLPYGRSF
jgi:hypothetical protein